MNIQLTLSLLRDEWMINGSSISAFFGAASNYLAGGTITDIFSELPLPGVPDNIALIVVNGVMMKADFCGGEGTRTLTDKINAAASDSKYSSIILYFESVPGGSVDGTEVMAGAVKTAAVKKPVLSVISGMCCSAGVWVASQSNEIWATSLTDMVGCIGTVAKIKKSNANSRYEIVYSDLSPDKNKEFTDTQLLKDTFLNPVAAMFQDAVKQGRGDRLKLDAKGVLSGATFIAGNAKKNGLIDGTMSFEKVVQRANYLSKNPNDSYKNKSGSGNYNNTNQANYKKFNTSVDREAAKMAALWKL